MAIWQITFYIIDASVNNINLDQDTDFDDSYFWKNSKRDVRLFKSVGLFLEENKSWSSQIKQYGDLKSNCLEVYFDDMDKILGLEYGADDYITKPVKPKVLVSKVKALLRRVKEESQGDVLNVGDIEINREEYKIIKDGVEIVLPRKEFELFYLLASKPGKVFKREEILDKVWGNEVVVGGRTIDVHIRKLREKIGDEWFKTIKGVGYKLDL